jgi:hypothetical protein
VRTFLGCEKVVSRGQNKIFSKVTSVLQIWHKETGVEGSGVAGAEAGGEEVVRHWPRLKEVSGKQTQLSGDGADRAQAEVEAGEEMS